MKVEVLHQKYSIGHYFVVHPIEKDGKRGPYLQQFGAQIPDERVPKFIAKIKKAYSKIRRVK